MIIAFVLVQVSSGKERKLLSLLKKGRRISEVYLVIGEYDLICKIEADDLSELEEIIEGEIRNLADIKAVSSMVSI
jgi:anthranilate phosphoribosyltransferase